MIIGHLIKVGSHPFGNLLTIFRKFPSKDGSHLSNGQMSIHQTPQTGAALFQWNLEVLLALLEPWLKKTAQDT